MANDVEHFISGLKRADVLLLLIEQRCDAVTGRYFVLSPYSMYLHVGKDLVSISVHGAGDRAALNSLIRKGLIEEVWPPEGKWGEPYGYRITEDGKLRTGEIM